MATLIPSFTSCTGKMTAGERRFARRLEEKLDDSCLLWYDVPIGPKKRHPDFVVLHPSRGLLVLEVKDWRLENIQSVTHTDVTLLTEQGIKQLSNPLQQARDYALAINQLLEKDAHLVQPTGLHKGKLLFPYGYGIVLSNITRKSFNTVPALQQVLDEHLVICKDEFTESVDPNIFRERLWAMSPYSFGPVLGIQQIDRIRWHLFPEIRITPRQLELLGREAESEIESVPAPDIVQILDLQQEQLARSLGDGHRVFHGVAGSGKTRILACRAQHLAERTQRPVLVLCYNVSLAAHLESIIKARGDYSGPPILVRHFHGWCGDLLRTYRVGLPDRTQYSGSAYIEQLVQRTIDAVGSGQIPTGLYGAVLIDEGHDFEADWLQLATRMASLETNSLLLLYDDAQNLYGKVQKRNFTFKSVGIHAQGRTAILRINYRNPAEVLDLASTFISTIHSQDSDTTTEGTALEAHPRLQPQTAGKRGAIPELVTLPSFGREAVYLAERVQQFHECGTSWNQIAIVYRAKFMGEALARQLHQADIPVEWLNRNQRSRFFHPEADSVKLLTMHASKGLEFEIVCIPGIGYLPNAYSDSDAESRLFYVAMTRATERLLLTTHRASEYAQKLEAGLRLAMA